ncbi:MAG: MerC domain-containing protein [Chitinophagales bacterium]
MKLIDWQKIGISLSVLCAIHCLLLPIFLLVASLWGAELNLHHSLELLLVATAFLIGGYTIYKDYAKHSQKLPAYLLLLSFPFFCCATFFHLHALFTVGSLLLATAQLYNWRLHRLYCKH